MFITHEPRFLQFFVFQFLIIGGEEDKPFDELNEESEDSDDSEEESEEEDEGMGRIEDMEPLPEDAIVDDEDDDKEIAETETGCQNQSTPGSAEKACDTA